MKFEDLIEKALKDRLIEFDAEQKNIIYIHIQKKRNWSNPEEKVQLAAYLELIYVYGYPVRRIQMFVTVQMGTRQMEADIIVYNDDAFLSPFIIVECKKEDTKESEFSMAVDQGFSYAIAKAAAYVWVTARVLNAHYSVDIKQSNARNQIAGIPRFGAAKQPLAKYYPDGIDEYGDPAFDLEVVSEADLTRIFTQAHQALWDAGKLNPSLAFDELDKLIFCKIWDEKDINRPEGTPYSFQIWNTDSDPIHKNQIDPLLARIQHIYEQGRKADPEVFKHPIELDAPKLRTIVKYLEGVNLSKTDLDSKGRAFETFLGTYFRGEFGQYFTPRNVVQFIVDAMPITNNSKVLDTSCGSGGFLLYALDKVRKAADIKFPKYKTEVAQSEKHYRYWHDFAEKRLFGIEISSQIARAAKMNMIIHDDGHTNVIESDGLVSIQEMQKINKGFEPDSFDFIITNPPFGSSAKLAEKAYMQITQASNPNYKPYHLATQKPEFPQNILNPPVAIQARKSQSTEVLFVEQCYNFLKPDGYFAAVLPDGILTNSSLQYVRDWISTHFRIVAVISLPQTAFTHTGAGVKSSVLVLRKYSDAITQRLEEDILQIQRKIVKEANAKAKLEALEAEKKETLRKHKGFQMPETPEYADFTQQPDRKTIEATEAFITWKSEISAAFTERRNELYSELETLYRQQVSTDYPILMAIADHIGYDTTGKTTYQNDLPAITEQLQNFITAIQNGTDSNFL